MKTHIERTDDDPLKKIPRAERVTRVANVRRRLPGIKISDEREPAPSLIEAFERMMEDTYVIYVPSNRCVPAKLEHLEGEVRRESKTNKSGTRTERIGSEGPARDSGRDLLKSKYVRARRGLAAETADLLGNETHQTIVRSFARARGLSLGTALVLQLPNTAHASRPAIVAMMLCLMAGAKATEGSANAVAARTTKSELTLGQTRQSAVDNIQPWVRLVAIIYMIGIHALAWKGLRSLCAVRDVPSPAQTAEEKADGRADFLERFTNTELQDVLTTKGRSRKGKKADIIERILTSGSFASAAQIKYVKYLTDELEEHVELGRCSTRTKCSYYIDEMKTKLNAAAHAAPEVT